MGHENSGRRPDEKRRREVLELREQGLSMPETVGRAADGATGQAAEGISSDTGAEAAKRTADEGRLTWKQKKSSAVRGAPGQQSNKNQHFSLRNL
jgi:hypothetical protein